MTTPTEPGWTLVPNEVAEFVTTPQYIAELNAEIARLRAALEAHHLRILCDENCILCGQPAIRAAHAPGTKLPPSNRSLMGTME